MRLRVGWTAMSQKVELLDENEEMFAAAWFRETDESEDVLDQLEWLARTAKEHLEGTRW